MKKILLSLKLIIFIFGILCFFLFKKTLFAQEVYDIIAFPARQQIEVSAGETKRLAVSFLNRTLFPKSGILGVVDFIVKGKDNLPIFLEKSQNSRYSASSWITLPYEQATIPADSKIVVYFDLKVPQNALPGGRYAALYFEGTPLGGRKTNQFEGSTFIAPRTMALLYIKIKGDVKEEASIHQFSAPKFLEYGPIKSKIEILNSGYIHLTPALTLKLYNPFNQIIEEKKLKEKNIFPEAITVWEEELGKKWMIGNYKIELLGYYGTKGKKLYQKINVFVFPWRIVFVIILALVIIFLLGRSFYKKTVVRERLLEEELEKEKQEIEKLKEMLRKRKE